ncbi:hypothetical protein GPALN_002226 [Globodera pallida]|nr:hypothetical protein GPALN_002226 [Globodera pallida]
MGEHDHLGPASLPQLPVLATHFLTDGRAMAMLAASTTASWQSTPAKSEHKSRQRQHPLPLPQSRPGAGDGPPGTTPSIGRGATTPPPSRAGIQQHQIWVTSPKLSGCYRCTAGAVFEAKCQTDHGITLAKVKFADGTLFALHCGDNGTTTVESIPFDLAEVFTEYRVKCPAGATTFDYRGSLPFSPNNSNSNSGKGSPEVADMNREAPGGYGGWRSTGDLEERTVWEPSPPQEEVSWPMSTRRLPTNPRRKKKPKKK